MVNLTGATAPDFGISEELRPLIILSFITVVF